MFMLVRNSAKSSRVSWSKAMPLLAKSVAHPHHGCWRSNMVLAVGPEIAHGGLTMVMIGRTRVARGFAESCRYFTYHWVSFPQGLSLQGYFTANRRTVGNGGKAREANAAVDRADEVWGDSDGHELVQELATCQQRRIRACSSLLSFLKYPVLAARKIAYGELEEWTGLADEAGRGCSISDQIARGKRCSV